MSLSGEELGVTANQNEISYELSTIHKKTWGKNSDTYYVFAFYFYIKRNIKLTNHIRERWAIVPIPKKRENKTKKQLYIKSEIFCFVDTAVFLFQYNLIL